MNGQTLLARQALRGALETRRRIPVGKSDPICVYDIAERLGIEVRFFGGNSFGGMYAKASQTILVPSLRPSGRRAFTCAHEIGHWFFGHGTRIDELSIIGSRSESDPEEYVANTFAGYLLMPPWAVGEAFERRRCSPITCTPLQAYTVAMQLGVGYGTLVSHLQWSLGLITPARADELLKTTPKQLRESLLGGDRTRHLVIADHAWTRVPIDLQVDDMAILPEGVAVEGRSASIVGSHHLGALVVGRSPGISRAEAHDGSWSAFVRVARRDFEGRSIYRHLEDPDVD